jgi:hypothetical protein
LSLYYLPQLAQRKTLARAALSGNSLYAREVTMFSKIFACDGDWSTAFWASIFRCNFTCDECVAESLDEFVFTVGAIGVLVSMPSNISKVWVKDSIFSSQRTNLEIQENASSQNSYGSVKSMESLNMFKQSIRKA